MGKAQGGLTPNTPGMCSYGIRMGPGEVGGLEDKHGKEHQASEPGPGRKPGKQEAKVATPGPGALGSAPGVPRLHTSSFVGPRNRALWETGPSHPCSQALSPPPFPHTLPSPSGWPLTNTLVSIPPGAGLRLTELTQQTCHLFPMPGFTTELWAPPVDTLSGSPHRPGSKALSQELGSHTLNFRQPQRIQDLSLSAEASSGSEQI